MDLLDPARLVFVIAAPRSGSTLLQRMLASHPEVATHPEPHLLTPLAHLGYYATVDAAPYDHVNAARALHEFCESLPGGEQDYLDALRAYALVLPFVRRLFPTARYVVLTRQPLAILHSVAHSFFGGDYAAATRANPILARYVPAIAACLRQPPAHCVHVAYEALVRHPEAEMRRVLAALGLGYTPRVVEYGAQAHVTKSFGDPVGVGRHTRPVTDSLATWQQDLRARPAALAAARAAVAGLDDADLALWGTPRTALFDGVATARGRRTRRPWDAYRLRRAALLTLRQHLPRQRLAPALRSLRYACDLLLREPPRQ